MTTAARPLSEIAAQWREARRLHVVYSALLERYALGLPPCRELESPVDRADPEVIKKVWGWFAQMDERVHVHQLRQLLQTTRLGNEDHLRGLIKHHLGKAQKADADRDKIDFLLVQYLSSCAPSGFYDRDVEFKEVAEILEPIVGAVGGKPAAWLKPLEEASQSLGELSSLGDLLQNGTLDKMRKLKSGAGEKYYEPAALVAITRFNFMVRRAFVRLIAADLQAIRYALIELESRGVQAIDCTAAQLGPQEPIERLKQICQEWKKPFRAAYAAGQNFRELVEIRAAVEKALTEPLDPSPAVPSGPATATVDLGFLNSETTADPGAMPAAGLDWESVPTSEELDITYPSNGSTGSQGATDVATEPFHIELPIETPASIAAQLFQGASVNTAVTWEAVDNEEEAAIPTPPAAPAPASADAESEPAEVLDIPMMVESISEQLRANQVKPGSVATISAKDLKLLLSSWEVGAFIQAESETAKALKNIVAARAILLQHFERRKRGTKSPKLREAIRLAKAEVTSIQQRISKAKIAKDLDGAINMAATCKRLQTLIAEAEKAA